MLKDPAFKGPLFIYYDTVFKMGDFYVTSLVVKLSIFKEKPILPMGYMVHEKKDKVDHKRFMDNVGNYITPSNKKQIVLCTDMEYLYFNEIWPNVTHVLCWNHVRRALKQWGFEHHLTPEEQDKAGDVL